MQNPFEDPINSISQATDRKHASQLNSGLPSSLVAELSGCQALIGMQYMPSCSFATEEQWSF